jgi:hypothetical protein
VKRNSLVKEKLIRLGGLTPAPDSL